MATLNKSTLYGIFLLLISNLSCNRTYDQAVNLDFDPNTPFIYGVASGDPTASSVIIWSATEAQAQYHGTTIAWRVATDSLFTNVVQNGNTTVDSSRGYAIKLEVSGLQPATKYYYSFTHNSNNSSTGITYTAPSGNSDSLSFALVSCSSLFSGYFNGYRQIASMRHLKGLIHVGDYVYDFVDAQERIRIPQPEPADPNDNSVEDWRNRHRLYLQDPDLREARRVLPWIQTWDNHDVSRNNPGASSKAFREFIPFKEDSQDTLKIWRSISYGNLLHIMMIDMNLEAGKDTFASGNEKVMRDPQFNWLKNELKNTTATWKFIGSEKLFSPWNLQGVSLPGGGLNGTWNGYPESRDSLLALIKQNSINNTVVLSGDLHMNLWSDLAIDPLDPQVYNGTTGSGGLGLEIMGTSISRGNVDESGISTALKGFLHSNSLSLNPQQQYINLYDHGFNTVTVYPDSLVARSYLCPILTNTNDITLEATRKALTNENHWYRVSTSVKEIGLSSKVPVYPNPSTSGFFTIDLSKQKGDCSVTIVDARGKVIIPRKQYSSEQHDLNVTKLLPGIYFAEIINGSKVFIERLVVNR